MLTAKLSQWTDEFLGYAPAKRATGRRVDEEDIRLISGFADIFAGIALIGLFTTLIAIDGDIGGLILSAAVAWGMTIPLVEKRRFAFCAIVLTGYFTAGLLAPLVELLWSFAIIPALIGLWFYWRRFHIPISGAAFIFLLLAFPIALILQLIENFGGSGAISDLAPIIVFLSALGLFAIALWLDMSDPARETGRSRIAFWLHLFSGPVLVWSLFSLFGIADLFQISDFSAGEASDNSPWLVVVLFLFFAFISLIIDRRALLMASYSTLIYAVGRIAYNQIVGDDETTDQIISVIVLATVVSGALIVLIAGGWSFFRGKLLVLLPPNLQAKFPPVSDWTPPVTPETVPDESEPLRLVLGLNDYIAAIGLITLFVGSLFIGWLLGDWNNADATGVHGGLRETLSDWRPWMMLVVPLLFLWLSGLFFVRRRKMALTALVLATLLALISLLGMLLASLQLEAPLPIMEALGEAHQHDAERYRFLPWVIISIVAGAAMSFAYWWVNRLPISFAYGFLLLLPLMFVDQLMVTGLDTDAQVSFWQLRLAIFGALAVGVAIWWDMQDPRRETQKSDTAFWMHFLAAAILVPLAYSLLDGLAWAGIAAIMLYALLLLIALVLDRRAVLVAAIPPMMTIDFFGVNSLFITGIILFAAMLALVIFWPKMRSAIGQMIPILSERSDTV